MASKLGGFFRKLTGAGAEAGAEAEEAAPEPQGPAIEYNGYEIYYVPRKQGGQWLTAGLITKAFPDGVKEHPFIRAETHPGQDGARDFAIIKAKQIIDEQGERLFKLRPAPESDSSE